MFYKSLVMKHISLFLISILFASCVTTQFEDEDDGIPLSQTDVRLEFYTEEPNSDEINFTYYDNAGNIDIAQVLKFEYDGNGNALPYIINWNDFGYRFVRGEAYRNNSSSAQLSVKLYVNDKLVQEDSKVGTSNQFARVVFDYIIKK